MAIGPLRVPVRVTDSYCRPGDEQRLFPNHPDYLTSEEVLEVFPSGLITHERFLCKGRSFRLAKRPMPNGTVYMAVRDDVNGASYGSGYATPDTAQRLRSMPLDAFSSNDMLDVSGSCTDVVPLPLPAHQQPSAQRQAALLSIGSNSMRDRLGSHVNALSAHNSGLPPSLSGGALSFACASGSFMTDLLGATESPIPLDRYKSFIRLFSTLSRMRESMGLPSIAPDVMHRHPDMNAWESPDAHDLVRQMLLVGECLTKFGTAEFVAGGNNSSRAITTKDYAKLLRMYLESNGGVFDDDFIKRLPLSLQDEALTVRTLLQTRCETNDMLFNQLVKHVGQEPTGGGAIVYNNSNVTANPINHMLASPKTLINTVANAWSKADMKRRTQLGAVGAVAVVALFVLKRKLFGGSSQRRGGRSREETEWGGGGGSRWSSRLRGADMSSRLLDERSTAERMAVRFITACHDELRRAQMNDTLLRRDWRLGPLRLALPGSGPVPEGYEPVQTSYCSLGAYMNTLDGGAPFPTAVFPQGLIERQSSGDRAREASGAVVE